MPISKESLEEINKCDTLLDLFYKLSKYNIKFETLDTKRGNISINKLSFGYFKCEFEVNISELVFLRLGKDFALIQSIKNAFKVIYNSSQNEGNIKNKSN
jgi:hypothetical protein